MPIFIHLLLHSFLNNGRTFSIIGNLKSGMHCSSLPGLDALKNKPSKQNLKFNLCHQRLLIWRSEPRMQKLLEPTCPFPWGLSVFHPVFRIPRAASMVGIIFKPVVSVKKSILRKASKLAYSKQQQFIWKITEWTVSVANNYKANRGGTRRIQEHTWET